MEQDLIDYREIAEKYTFAEHAAKANDYFAKITIDSPVARKPFASPHEVPGTVGGIAMVVSGLNLFHAARVLDFGAGTCWVSRLLAMMGCEVTAADVSANALRIGKQLINSDPVGRHLNVSFALLDGPKLPFADESFDRIVIFDAFHHCRDQLPMIGEFFRVLGPGGIVAFHEPGPDHSRSPQSQYEMRHFDVIEGDVVVEDLFAEAERVGFERMQLAAYGTHPAFMDLDGYREFLGRRGDKGAWLAEQARLECEQRRVFFLYKGGHCATDSRSSTGLAASLDGLSLECTPAGIEVAGVIANTGGATWLPSFGDIGSVNLGAHMKDEHGTYDHDWGRLAVSTAAVPPGGDCMIKGLISWPVANRFTLTLDLVAEGVAWFELCGTHPVTFTVDRAMGLVERAG
ncbi:class I SAM-dependent methyltransferase [Pseudoxanthomonas sp. JBR18]|uniref:class I SAM-dependent methyltransferase n=1 Tax=Pseudoxanthomonas sp. JBR18 TaxID=2969308 RepID=UPI0023064EC0|nr:class I SAM-dependent methyltransferase [Pseudoxanthomonas sp. JBR18]WCE04419.1 class I SAM-dependent methyltransferase [Pseudoxanthomonas sp. JBR18]